MRKRLTEEQLTARREAVQAQNDISERRAYQSIGLPRSELRYLPQINVQKIELQAQLMELA